MSNLFTELKRRNVIRVTAAYVIVAWLLAQVADLALQNFGSPDWVVKTILLLLAMGLPVAVVLAWAFELTPQGIRREKDIDREQSMIGVNGRRLDFLIIGLLAIALVYFIYESRFESERPGLSELTTVAGIPAKSIAVIPFANFGSNEADSYLADGLAETLLNLLVQIDELQVAARTSAFKFRGTNEDVRIIGKQLGVATVLEGSVQRSGNRIRITAQLINVEDGFHLFSQSYERELDDIFAVQDEIAQAVVDALELTLLGKTPQPTQDIDAYESLLSLRSALRASTGSDMLELIESLRALTRDYPEYADAFATLSEAYKLHSMAAGLIPEDALASSIIASQKSIQLEPSNAIGYIALGRAYLMGGRFVEAAPVVERALQLQPGSADVLVMQGELLGMQGRFRDAVAVTERALLRDPLNANTRSALANRYLSAGRYDEAVTTLDFGLEINPEDLKLLWNRSQVLYKMGRPSLAMSSIAQLIELEPNYINALQDLFFIHIDAGDLDTARLILEQGEALSINRLADERALYCYIVGDKSCWHNATTRMLATRERFFVQTWHARMLYESGLVEEAIQSLLPAVEYFDQTGDSYGEFETRTNLAALYHLTGDIVRRDEVIDTIISPIRFGIEHGDEFWAAYFDIASAAAARGDADEALRNLEEAYARGFRQLWQFYHRIAFDPLHDNSEFQSFKERIRAENAAQLTEVGKHDGSRAL